MSALTVLYRWILFRKSEAYGYLTFLGSGNIGEDWDVEEDFPGQGSAPGCGSPVGPLPATRDLWDASPADKKVHVKFNVQRRDLFLNFKMPTCFAVIDKERNLWCSW